MMENDPPAGTRLMFLRDVTRGTRTAKSGDIAYLIGSVRKYTVDRPEDEFRVHYQGEEIIVQRRDIAKASR